MVIAASATAQIYKCTVDGKTVYSDAPCPGARQVDPAQLRANSLPAAPQPRQQSTPMSGPLAPQPEAAGAASPQRQAVTTVCPSEQEIRNLETSANSITLGQKEKAFLYAEIRRARACSKEGGNYSADDWKRIQEHQAGQNRIDPRDRRRERDLAEGRHAPSASDRENERMRNDKLTEAVESANRRANTPVTLFGCSAAGCSGSNGWYTRAGPNLTGPNGEVCVSTGGSTYSCN